MYSGKIALPSGGGGLVIFTTYPKPITSEEAKVPMGSIYKR
jgi:hypothetical protein